MVIPAVDRAPLNSLRWIGDGLRGAAVDATGTLVWYATGGIDARPEFCALLDAQGGAVRVGPVTAGPGRSPAPAGGAATTSYRPGTNITEIDLDGVGGRIRVTDLLPWPGPNDQAPGRVVRLVTALSGPVEVEVEVRPDTTLGPAPKVSAFGQGVAWGAVVVRTGFPLAAVEHRGGPATWRAVRTLQAGERLVVTVDRLDDEHHQPLAVDAAVRLVDDTAAAWRSWVGPLWVAGPHQAVVERAALTLRTLTGPGAPFAAGTTSLPRRSGGERTEDERLVRWRDAAGTAATLARVGLVEDAEAAERWVRRSTEATDLPWPVALSAEGGPLPGVDLLPLSGWRRSEPVVVGVPENAPVDLDLYGDVVAAISASTSGGAGPGDPRPPGGVPAAPGPLSAALPVLGAAADWVVDHWGEADGGIWALGGPPRRPTASRLQAWYALDRMTRLARAANPLDLTAVPWQQTARDILRWLESDALAVDGGLKLSASTVEHADAALLRVAWRGPWPAHHPVVTATVTRTVERLSNGVWVLRHSPEVDDGRPGSDNPDVMASLWAVRALAAVGRWEEAHERMEGICALIGPDGMASATVDPLAGELVGNLPSAGAHLALIDAAVALAAGPA
jgi:hypothetical protein